MLTRFKATAVAFICLFLMAFSVTGFAQATAAVSTPVSTPSKIAFVNMQEAVVTCNEGKQESAVLQQRFASKTSAIQAQDSELKKLKDDYQAAAAKLNDDEKNTRLKVIQDKQKVFDRNFADYQSETQEAQQEAINRIVKKMLPVLEKYATANGYTAVFDLSNPQAPPVLWIKRDALITRQLVDAYNAESGVQAPAAPAPSTPPKP